MVNIPKFKKKIGSFLRKEDGKISKENLVKAGLIIGAFALAALPTQAACPPNNYAHNQHCNDLSGPTFLEGVAKVNHNHGHGSHASHGSHGSTCGSMSW